MIGKCNIHTIFEMPPLRVSKRGYPQAIQMESPRNQPSIQTSSSIVEEPAVIVTGDPVVVMQPVREPISEPIREPISRQPDTTGDILPDPTTIIDAMPVYPSPTRDTRPAIFNNDNCIMCGLVVCNMNIHAGFSLLIAFVLLISLGIWMALDPDLFNQLLPIASFLLGVIFPSPVFSSMMNRKPRSPEEYDKMVRVNARRRESLNV